MNNQLNLKKIMGTVFIVWICLTILQLVANILSQGTEHLWGEILSTFSVSLATLVLFEVTSLLYYKFSQSNHPRLWLWFITTHFIIISAIAIYVALALKFFPNIDEPPMYWIIAIVIDSPAYYIATPVLSYFYTNGQSILQFVIEPFLTFLVLGSIQYSFVGWLVEKYSKKIVK